MRFGIPDETPRILEGYEGSPIALIAQITINPGESIDLPADALRNLSGDRIVLDCMSWVADAQQSLDTTDPPTVTVGAPGASISLTINSEGRQITAGFVPLYNLGESVGQDVEHAVLGVATGGASAMRLLGAYSSGLWKFDHPLELRPSEAFAMHITHTGLLNLPIVLSIAFHGRQGKDVPSSRWVPYVASWVTSFNPSDATATVPLTSISTERDLVNRAGKQIRVHRFIGRLLRQDIALDPSGAAAYLKNAEQVFPTVEGTRSDTPSSRFFANAVDSFLTITVRDSGSNDNVPVAIPFRQVFEPEAREWEVESDLEPSGYYTVELNLAVPAIIDSTIQPSIAMIGSYEV